MTLFLRADEHAGRAIRSMLSKMRFCACASREDVCDRGVGQMPSGEVQRSGCSGGVQGTYRFIKNKQFDFWPIGPHERSGDSYALPLRVRVVRDGSSAVAGGKEKRK